LRPIDAIAPEQDVTERIRVAEERSFVGGKDKAGQAENDGLQDNLRLP
jgi:hypothetical protein